MRAAPFHLQQLRMGLSIWQTKMLLDDCGSCRRRSWASDLSAWGKGVGDGGSGRPIQSIPTPVPLGAACMRPRNSPKKRRVWLSRGPSYQNARTPGSHPVLGTSDTLGGWLTFSSEGRDRGPAHIAMAGLLLWLTLTPGN